MHLFSLAKNNKLLAFVTLCSLLVMSLASGLSSDHHAYAAERENNTSSYRVQKGTMTKVATIDPTNLASHVAQSTSVQRRANLDVANQTMNTPVPAASSQPLENTNRLIRNFLGLTSAQSTNANGYPTEPPDQGLCVSDHTVMEIVNSVIGFYQRDGSQLSSVTTVNGFFNESPGVSGELIFNPRCYFDPQVHTWFATAVAIDPDYLHAHLDIAVNPNANPITAWTIYHPDATESTDPGCPCFPDDPVFGVDHANIYLSANSGYLSTGGPPGNGAEIFAFAKTDLVSLASSVHQVRFSNLSLAGIQVETVSPAYTNSFNESAGDAAQPSAEYFVNSFFRTASDHRLGIWSMTNQQAVAKGGTPQLSSSIIDSETYTHPPLAPTPNGYMLTTNDARVMQVQFINGNLWVSLETGLQVSGTNTPTSGAAWFEIHPQLNNKGGGLTVSSARILDQGYISATGNYLLTPTIETSPTGTTVMVMTLAGPGTFPSVVYSVRYAYPHAQFGPIHIAAAGIDNIQGYGCAPTDGGVCSWGGYTAAILDPANDGTSIWMAGEYIAGPLVSQENWGTRIVEISTAD